MKNLLYIVCACFVLGYSQIQAQLVLPINKGGKWYLKSKGSEIQLPTSYGYVDNFNQHGTAFFEQLGNYGILNTTGKEVFPAKYLEINAFPNDFYELKDSSKSELIRLNPIESFFVLDSLVKLDETWLKVFQDSSVFLLNVNNQQRIALKNPWDVFLVKFNYVFISRDSSLVEIYTPSGELFEKGKINPDSESISDGLTYNYGYNYIYIAAKNKRRAVDENGVYEFPKGATNCIFNFFTIKYQEQGKAYLLDRASRKIKMSYACDYIDEYTKDTYRIQRDRKIGLLNKSGQVLIPMEYTHFYFTREFIYVYKDNLVGLLDSNYRLVVPCKYTHIIHKKNYLELYNYDFSGVYSLKAKREILPTLYDKIVFENNVLKAWTGSNLTILELNDNHQVVNKLILENAITVGKQTRGSKGIFYDPRLLTIGWFFDTIPVFNKQKEWLRTKTRWGLSSPSDSILLKSQFDEPLFIPGAAFSLIKNPRQEKTKDNYFLTFWTTGKMIRKYQILSVDTFSYQHKDFHRFSHFGGWGAILQSDSIAEFSYLDPEDAPYIRYCLGGNMEYVEPNDVFAVPILNLEYSYKPTGNPYTKFTIQKPLKTYTHCKYTFGQWNFLDSSGNQLFATNFEFAHPYFKGTAIVKTKTGWGVVDGKGFVIEPIYAEIQRIKSLGDTIFLVKSLDKGSYYTDGKFQRIQRKAETPTKKKGKLHVFESKGKYSVYNDKHEVLSEDLASVRLHDYNRFVTKTKKVYSCYDETGSEIGTSLLKPEEFISEEAFTCEQKSKLGVLHIDGDTLAPFEFKSIQRVGNWFLATRNGSISIYDASWKLIKTVENKVVLFDPIHQFWVESDGSKQQVFDSLGKKKFNFSFDFPIEHFYNGLLFTSKNKGIVLNTKGEIQTHFGQWSELTFLENGYFILKGSENTERLFDASGKEIQNQLGGKKKIRFVADHIICFHTKKNVHVYNLENGILESKFTRVVGSFSNGKLLVSTEKAGRNFHFVDLDFNVQNPRKYQYAKPYEDGFAAVKFPSGWTVIDTLGQQLSFPSFGEIGVVNQTLFSIKNLPKYGVMTSSGKVILPVENEKIEVLASYFRLLKNGELFYTNLKGKEVL